MKQFLSRQRKSMLLQALRSSSILSLFVYAVIRILAFEFTMNWFQEVVLFTKIIVTCSFMITTATVGLAWVYRQLIIMQRKAAKE